MFRARDLVRPFRSPSSVPASHGRNSNHPKNSPVVFSNATEKPPESIPASISWRGVGLSVRKRITSGSVSSSTKLPVELRDGSTASQDTGPKFPASISQAARQRRRRQRVDGLVEQEQLGVGRPDQQGPTAPEKLIAVPAMSCEPLSGLYR